MIVCYSHQSRRLNPKAAGACLATFRGFFPAVSDLNGFLQADIGTERNGGSLSVLSALARLGEDPWNEAGRLASLPKAAAIADFARTIANMPSSLWPLPEAEMIAARLTALLPDGAHRKAALPRPKLGRTAIVLILLAAGGAIVFNILLGSFIHPTRAGWV